MGLKQLKVRLELLIILLVVFSAKSATVFSQNVDEELLDRPITLQMEKGTMIEAVNRLALDNSIPIGWEFSSEDHHNQHTLNIVLRNTRLRDVLDQLMLQDHSYRWIVDDGVINIIPNVARDEVLEKLLSLKIKNFETPRRSNTITLRDSILDLPEIEQFLHAKGLKPSHSVSYSGPIPTLDTEFNLKVSGVLLRSLLNKVIRQSDARIWLLSRSGENLEEIHLTF
jgi:hypothetical protein